MRNLTSELEEHGSNYALEKNGQAEQMYLFYWNRREQVPDFRRSLLHCMEMNSEMELNKGVLTASEVDPWKNLSLESHEAFLKDFKMFAPLYNRRMSRVIWEYWGYSSNLFEKMHAGGKPMKTCQRSYNWKLPDINYGLKAFQFEEQTGIWNLAATVGCPPPNNDQPRLTVHRDWPFGRVTKKRPM